MFRFSSILLSAFLFSLPATAGELLKDTQVSGVSGCIMRSGGVVGWGTAPVNQQVTIREPSSGEYFDAVGPSWFGDSPAKPGPGFDYGPTNWQRFTNNQVNILYWGTFQTYYSVTPGESVYWHADTGSPTSQYTPSGWTYHRGSYVSLNSNSGMPFESYRIYRTRLGTISVPGNSQFENCWSSSNGSNSTWINGQFVTSNQINSSFTNFVNNFDNFISNKKINLALVSDVISVARASQSSTAKSNSTLFTGVKGNGVRNNIEGSSSSDATSLSFGVQ